MAVDLDQYLREVRSAVLRSIMAGNSSYEDVLSHLGSPEPRLIKRLFDEITTSTDTGQFSLTEIDRKGSAARRLSAYLPLMLPAADPIRCQWWFTVDAAEFLARTCWEFSEGGPVAFLGAPTAGYHFAHWYEQSSSILDADSSVIRALGNPPYSKLIEYDINSELPAFVCGKHNVVLADPPWYPDSILRFIHRSRQLLGDVGYILSVIPPRLTRPGLIEERNDLIGTLIGFGFETISIETASVTYHVPEFEARAYSDIDEFTGRRWRKGDLLILRVAKQTGINPPPTFLPNEVLAYARDHRKARFFLAPGQVIGEQTSCIESVAGFEDSVSMGGISKSPITVWGTNRRAASLREVGASDHALKLWEEGKSQHEAANILINEGMPDGESYCQSLQDNLGLWSEPDRPINRRDPDSLSQHRAKLLSPLAAEATERKYEYSHDGFRLDFQRDRDRILWSQSFRQLANKTQLFPVESDDQLRRRFSHSIEVMQLAATIAYGFGLDRDLTEAGALAHDIGHCAFGHAGEHALNNVLNEISENLGGFNHYEHGVDVVEWLDSPYRSPAIGGFPGLNLTPETIECIIKHTFHRDLEPMGQSGVLNRSKYAPGYKPSPRFAEWRCIDDTSCHLEGQAVRIADKVSYLISDLEDGIRVGAFLYQDLTRCKFFQRPPIDMRPSGSETLSSRFVSQRRAILKVIMEDIMTSTDRNMARHASLDEIRRSKDYAVNFSKELQLEISEIWSKLQVGKLHSHPSVKTENMQAARIMRYLFIVYATTPELIDSEYCSYHSALWESQYLEWYKQAHGGNEIGIPQRLVKEFSIDKAIGMNLKKQGDNYQVPVPHVVMAKDYVASLTDIRATEEYKRISQSN